MTTRSTAHRMLAASLAAALALGTLAPAASAGHAYGKQKKWKRADYVPVERVMCAPARVVEVRESCGLPAFAGFVGGIALGAVLASHASDGPPQGYYAPPPAYCPPPPAYTYWDPYCDTYFTSLDLYLAHVRHGCGHPRVVRVFDVPSHQCVAVLHWEEGHWEDWDD